MALAVTCPESCCSPHEHMAQFIADDGAEFWLPMDGPVDATNHDDDASALVYPHRLSGYPVSCYARFEMEGLVAGGPVRLVPSECTITQFIDRLPSCKTKQVLRSNRIGA